MKTETIGTVIDGSLMLSERVEMPDNTRVRVSIEPLEDWRHRFRAGLKDWKQLCETHPIHAGGRRYTRGELHERR